MFKFFNRKKKVKILVVVNGDASVPVVYCSKIDFKMEVDHIRSYSQGGSDELYNLQPLCRPCNRTKSANMTVQDSFKTTINSIMHPVDTFVKVPLRKAWRQNKALKVLGLNKRR